MDSVGYYVLLGVMWFVAAGFQLSTVRMLPSSMRGFKLFGIFSSVFNLGLATFYFTVAFLGA